MSEHTPPEVAESVPPAAPPAQTRMSFGEWLRWRFLGVSVDAVRVEQHYALSDAIQRHPQAAVNYLLRAELYIQQREFALARADLTRALQLADEDYTRMAWGLLAQSVQERARQMLAQLPDEA